jgi:hypothetical protein
MQIPAPGFTLREWNPACEKAYDRQLAKAPWQARLVKLADVYDNISDSVDDKMRAKAIQQAVRALGIAGNEPQVKVAAREVQFLISGRKT